VVGHQHFVRSSYALELLVPRAPLRIESLNIQSLTSPLTCECSPRRSHAEGSFCSRRHVHAEHLERICLVHQSVVHVFVGFLHELAEPALLEHVGLVGPPEIRYSRFHPAHLVFEVLLSALSVQVGGEVDLEVPVGKFHGTETHLQVEVLVEANEVLNGRENGLQGVIYDVLAHLAGGCYGDGVGVDRAESLLIDGLLAARGCDLLLSVVAA